MKGFVQDGDPGLQVQFEQGGLDVLTAILGYWVTKNRHCIDNGPRVQDPTSEIATQSGGDHEVLAGFGDVVDDGGCDDR